MKTFSHRLIVLSTMLALMGGCLKAQESTRIIYEVIPQFEPESFKSREAEEIMIRASQIFSGFEFELLIDDKESTFKKTDPMIEDYTDILLYKLALGFCSGDEIWYTKKDHLEKTIYKVDLEGEILLTLREDVKWEISNETKLIGKHIATKATATRKMGSFLEKIEAWFTPELPYFFGPLGYNGLPGLILEMNRDKVRFKFKKLDKASFTAPPPTVERHMNFENYYQILDARMAKLKKEGR